MANDRKVANLFVSMRAELGELKLNVAEMKRTFDTGFAGIKQSAATLAGTLAGTFSVAALVGFGKQVADLGDKLSDLSDQTGISIRILGGIKPILDASNSSVDSFAKGFNKLQKSLGDLSGEGKQAAEALQAIKLDPKQIANASPDQAFEQIVGGLGKVGNANERAAIATRLFNKSAAEMIPAILQLAETGIPKLSQAQADAYKTLGQFKDQLVQATAALYNFASVPLGNFINFWRFITGNATDREKLINDIDAIAEKSLSLAKNLKIAQDLRAKGITTGVASDSSLNALKAERDKLLEQSSGLNRKLTPENKPVEPVKNLLPGTPAAKDTGVQDFFAGLQKQIQQIDNDFIKLRDGDKIAKEIALDLQLADFNQKRLAEGKPIASIAEFKKYKDTILEASDALEKLNFERAQLAGAVRAETLQKGPQEDTRGLLNFGELQQAQEALDKLKLTSIDAKEKLKDLGQQLSIDAIDTRQLAGKEQQRVAGITVEFIKVAKQIEQIGFTAGASQEEIASSVALAWEGAFKKIRDGAELTDSAKAFNNIASGIENAFNQTLQGVLQGTQTWGEAMKNLMGNIGASIANELTKAFILNPLFDALLGGKDTSGNRSGGILGGAVNGIGNFIAGLIPQFDTGGIVPGPIGMPQFAMVHGGETVLPTHKSGVSFGSNQVVYNIDARGAQRGVGPEIRQAIAESEVRAIKAAPGAVAAERKRSSNYAKTFK